jgi:hypothetical protein
LVADRGDRDGDFAWTVPGELAYFGPVCGRDDDDECGCGRSFSGVVTGRSTTVATVTELTMTRPQLVELLAEHFVACGWSNPRKLAGDMAREILATAGEHPVGTRLRRDGDLVGAE